MLPTGEPRNMSGAGKLTDRERLIRLGKERVSTTLKRFGTIRQTAIALMVSHTVLRQYLSEVGLKDQYDPEFATKQKRVLMSKHHKIGGRAGLGKWLEEHPNDSLPNGSIKEIAKKTGCSIDQVKTYMYRIRKEIKEELAKLPDLRKVNAILLTNEGLRLETKQLDWYRFMLNRRTFDVTLFCGDKKGNEWQVPIPKVEWFVKTILNPASMVPQSTITSLASSLLAQNTSSHTGGNEPDSLPVSSLPSGTGAGA